MENTETAGISLTQGAVLELKRIIEEESLSAALLTGKGLRLGVDGGGCAGMSYTLGFDDEKDNDLVFTIEDIPIFMNKAHSLYLSGMEVDYQDGLNARGFVFNNPNANSTCGCGTSFGI